MDEDYEGDDFDTAPTFPWSWWSLVVALFQFLHGVASAAENTLSGLTISAVGAANHQVAQRQFADQARVDIEQISE